MGKEKTRYQELRDAKGWSREKASEKMPGISPERLERIENSKVVVTPEDIIAMAEAYKEPGLCNYFCSNECSIGRRNVPEVKSKELAQIAVETLNSLNRLNRDKDRFLEIVEDGKVTDEEITDFLKIKETLEKMDASIGSFKLWIDKAVIEGDMKKLGK